ncbi:hypothetical protein JAAARDRAFT_614672, partial [Jaapia argillacea MUCL 33604]
APCHSWDFPSVVAASSFCAKRCVAPLFPLHRPIAIAVDFGSTDIVTSRPVDANLSFPLPSRKYQFASELATGAASSPDSARAESATVGASPTLLPPQLCLETRGRAHLATLIPHKSVLLRHSWSMDVSPPIRSNSSMADRSERRR